MRIVETEACVAEGCAALRAADPRLAAVLDRTGLPPLRRVPDGFVALRDIVMGQMVSTASARAIIGRLDAAGLRDAAAVLAAGPEALTACGLSRQKAGALLKISASDIDYNGLRSIPDALVEPVLTAIPGVGPWTAHIYLLTALGRADAFAPGDLALQEAARAAFDLPARPTARALAGMAAAWSPWRGVAARALWAYYRLQTSKEGLA